MTLAATTLSAAVGVNDISIVVAGATNFAAGNLLIIDRERMRIGRGYTSGTTIPVMRGQDGTATATHLSGASVLNGIGALDFPAVFPTAVVDGISNVGEWNGTEVTATGATGTTATALPTNVPCVVTVNGVSGAGVALTTGAAQPGAMYAIKNNTTGAINVYAVGGTINGTTGTTAFAITVTGNKGGFIVCTAAGAWQSIGPT